MLVVSALAWLLSQQESHPRLDLVTPAIREKADRPYVLQSERDGLVYRGEDFTAHVAADGSVRFEDKRGPKLTLPSPAPLPPGTPTLAGTLRDLLAQRRPKAKPRPATTAPPASIDYISPNWADPRELCQDPRASCFLDRRNVVAMGAFSDWERHLVGMPDKTAHREEKARFLAATAPMRERMAEAAHAEDLRVALLDLPALLDRVWSDRRRSAAERRRLLYELWAEYIPNPEATPARATILGFIRRRLPAGSPDAYTDDELARYRAASPGFEPY